jgi:hypothetical protein
VAEVEVLGDPVTYAEAMRSPEAQRWEEAMLKEMGSLVGAGTWTLCTLPPGAKVIGVRWVYKTKRDEMGNVTCFKARLVRSPRQVPGVDCGETFAPVARLSSLRLVLALAAKMDWDIDQMDVETAFLNAPVQGEVYVKQPPGHEVRGPNGEELVCRLHRSLYGLKDSPRNWNTELDTWLRQYGLVPTDADVCVYVKGSPEGEEGVLIVIVYVDDLVIVGSRRRSIDAFKRAISGVFRMKDLGVLGFVLGMEVRRDRARRTLEIRQTAYVDRMLERFGMGECRPVATPMEERLQLPRLSGGCGGLSGEYMSLVGSLQYAAIVSRPDIAFAVQALSRHLQCSGEEHWMAGKRVLRYLRGTRTLGIKYSAEGARDGEPLVGYAQELQGFSDADWAGDRETRRSTTGYVFKMAGGSVSWGSKLQQSVALSSAESEYMAASVATQEALYLRRLLGDLGVEQRGPTVIWEDNQGCVALAKNPVHHQRTKHIDIRYHFVRECVASNEIDLVWIPTQDQQADLLTKALGAQRNVYLRDKLLGYKID